MTTRYERVRFKPENGKSQTVILKITGDSRLFLSGVEVDKIGDEVRHGKAEETRHIIDKKLISRRTPMVFNLMYAELEVSR